MKILSVILQSKQTQNGKKCLSQLQRSKMKTWWCLRTAKVEKKPQQTQGKLKNQNEIDLLVYKTQWFLEHWLMMSECLGLPKAVNWNVTLVCLSAWAIYGKFPLHDKGRESRRCRSLKAIPGILSVSESSGVLPFNSVTKNTGQDGCGVCWCFSLNKAQISVCIIWGYWSLKFCRDWGWKKRDMAIEQRQW